MNVNEVSVTGVTDCESCPIGKGERCRGCEILVAMLKAREESQ